jgi:monoamine oxidase
VLECFVRIFGQNAANPAQYLEKVWADDPWSRGCYGCYMQPGGWTASARRSERPWGESTGLGQRPQRSGLATWMGRSSRDSEWLGKS